MQEINRYTSAIAASVVMIEANLLLATAGKKADSFVQADPMRLASGVLSGMGFIGAGTILRRGTLIRGSSWFSSRQKRRLETVRHGRIFRDISG